MSARERRRPPFAWVALDALALIRRALPSRAQTGARTALLAMAEAASRRRDGDHAEGDPLRDLAALAGLSERRLLGHLRELESLGLARIEERRDEAGRDGPKLYALVDRPDETSDRGDETSDRGDETSDRDDVSSAETSDPTRASEGVEPQEEENDSPGPPQAGGSDQRITFRKGNGRPDWGRDRRRGANPRARGTNPRAVARQEQEAQAAAAAHAAAAAIEPPSDDATATWKRVRDELRRAVANSASAWPLWLEPLTLLGTTSDGVLVVAAPAESRSWVEGSFARLLTACFEAAGATGRLATGAEARGVEAAGARGAA